MHLDNGTVQTPRLDLDAHELLMLQFLEEAIENASFGSSVHARIDRVPVAETLREAAPLAAVVRDVQDRVDHLKAGKRNIPARYRQKCLYPTELLQGDFHVS